MLQRYTIVCVLLLCNCSSTPVTKQNVILAKDYKHYITLKDQQEHKTIPQKLKEILTSHKLGYTIIYYIFMCYLSNLCN